MANQIRKLTVRLPTDCFDSVLAHNMSGDKAHRRNIHCVTRAGTVDHPVLGEDLSDLPIGAVWDQGQGRCIVKRAR